MRISALVFAAISACLTAGSALAHPGNDRYGDRYERREWRDHHDRRDYRNHHRPYYGHHYRPLGAGPYHRIHRGDMLPRHYWDRTHWVGNWRRQALPRPPYGHNWVRTGHDYVLVDAYTGRVVRVIIRR